MTKDPSNRKPLSPVERLENINDALFADELLETEFEAEDAERADAVIRAAIAQASAASPGSVPPPIPQVPPVTNAAPSPERASETTDPRGRRWPTVLPPIAAASTPSPDSSTRGFAGKFGIHPVAAVVLSGINLFVVFTGWGTGGFGLLLDIPLAAPVAWFIAFVAQKRYGDSPLRVLIKGLAMAFLTAFPFPLAPFILIPAGLVGLFRRKGVETRVK